MRAPGQHGADLVGGEEDRVEVVVRRIPVGVADDAVDHHRATGDVGDARVEAAGLSVDIERDVVPDAGQRRRAQVVVVDVGSDGRITRVREAPAVSRAAGVDRGERRRRRIRREHADRRRGVLPGQHEGGVGVGVAQRAHIGRHRQHLARGLRRVHALGRARPGHVLQRFRRMPERIEGVHHRHAGQHRGRVVRVGRVERRKFAPRRRREAARGVAFEVVGRRGRQRRRAGECADRRTDAGQCDTGGGCKA